MAEYLIQEETLQGIGDKIRVLMGTEDIMTPAEMQNDLDIHNTEMNQVLSTQDDLIEQITTTLSRKIPENLRDELDTQDNLIAQIAAALEGKMGASGGSTANGVLTVSETFDIDAIDSAVDANLSLLVNGEQITQAVGIIEGTPIAFCIWRTENSRHLRLSNAWGYSNYIIQAGEYPVIITYTQDDRN